MCVFIFVYINTTIKYSRNSLTAMPPLSGHAGIYKNKYLMQFSLFLKVFFLSPFPLRALLEGTHDDRVAGDNTRHAHR